MRRRLPTSISRPRREWWSLRVRAQVLGEFVDPLGEQRDLDLGGAGVAIGAAVLADQLALFLLGQAHS